MADGSLAFVLPTKFYWNMFLLYGSGCKLRRVFVYVQPLGNYKCAAKV